MLQAKKGYSSVTKCLPRLCSALGLVLPQEKEKSNGKWKGNGKRKPGKKRRLSSDILTNELSLVMTTALVHKGHQCLDL